MDSKEAQMEQIQLPNAFKSHHPTNPHALQISTPLSNESNAPPTFPNEELCPYSSNSPADSHPRRTECTIPSYSATNEPAQSQMINNAPNYS